MKIIFYLLGTFTGLICLVGTLKSEGFGFFYITFSISFTLFFLGNKLGNNSDKSSDLKLDSKKQDLEYQETDTKIYSKEIDIPQISKSNISLPEKDNWETDYLIEEDNSIPVNLLTLIEYVDAKNQYSKRRITIKRMVPWANEYALLAFCHERQSHRTFKLSGIKSMCDLETGELITDPYNYLVQRFQDSPLGKWTKFLSEFEKEILILVFVAKVDGRMTSKERKIIFEYANQRANNALDFNTVDSEIKNLYCELKEFNQYLNKIKTLTEIEKNDFITTLDSIIRADKKVDPMELASLEKIKAKIL
ncbi:TerB family tellurite resistance protein [Leptospira meyeri]|uniref:tellurite resistance TerB family protein n=1 Tax=Leptospira meyeri TaxID=29508 RepID=UPI0002BD9838|nr:TerB family tellurite resistance protein [Leptospira meyeri]EMJ86351.1 tellurite resistance protein TerB [Leptospira meyeri serovar Semaranga str. Veldrot Semarang 173]